MLEDTTPISLLNFLEISYDCKPFISKSKLISKKFMLPSFSNYLNEDEFAKVYIASDKKNLYFHVVVKHPFTKSVYPEIRRGDSVELFFDTKNLKTKGYITKFCHHFAFFPEEIQGYKVKEVTRFRTDDMHKLTDPQSFKVFSEISPTSYFIDIEIPLTVLYGFDIQNSNKLGFNYRINRYIEPSQHFVVSSNEYKIERNPYLWASMNLVDN